MRRLAALEFSAEAVAGGVLAAGRRKKITYSCGAVVKIGKR